MIKKLIITIITIIPLTPLSINLYNLYNTYTQYHTQNIKLKTELYKNDIYNNDSNLEKLKTHHQEVEDKIINKYQTTNIQEINQQQYTLSQNNTKLTNEIQTLKEQLTSAKKQKESLQTQYTVLKKKKEEEERSRYSSSNSTSGDAYQITPSYTLNQYPNYPTGCESVALYLLLRYNGIYTTPDAIISKLDKGSLPYMEGNTKYGGNPYIEFVGNPYTSNSYGTYEYAISKVANQYKSGIINGTGMSLNQVLSIVKQNRPVLVWTSMQLAAPYISTSWIYKPTGVQIQWKANEHAVVIVGYSSNSVIISDPIGGAIKYQNRQTFESRYNYYGKHALYY